VRVLAVNDRPRAVGPSKVKAFEDLPLHFMVNRPVNPTTGEIEEHLLKVQGLQIEDPDFKDYLFDTRPFTINISCSHGRLFLNEEFLMEPGVSAKTSTFGADPLIKYYDWGEGMEYRGLHFADLDALGQRVDEPQFGAKYSAVTGEAGCQFRPQCSDGPSLKSDDSQWGFFTTQVYGIVYRSETFPLDATNSKISGWRKEPYASQRVGCGICPGIVGNKFISLRGKFADINKALELVTYLPDPNFNTRTGIEETIVLQVSDNGAQGNDASKLNPLTHELKVPVTVESINDRPLIGRRVQKPRVLTTYDIGNTSPETITADYSVEAINKTMDSECFAMPPASADYDLKCGPDKREYIDIDEDTRFYVGPHVLWVHDVDADEANNMPDLRRYCCPPAGEIGCICGRACRCGTAMCKCATPAVCMGNIAGNLLVSIEVAHGLLSFYPPAGRTAFPTDRLTFMTNTTVVDMKDGGLLEACKDQLKCMQNVTRLQIRTNIIDLQLGIEQNFLSYIGLPDYFGKDKLEVFVSDQGNTDECYNSTLTQEESVNIRVVAVNDPPVISGGIDQVLLYRKGQRCYVDFGELGDASNPEGLSLGCKSAPEISRLPALIGPDGQMNSIEVQDVDLLHTAYGNISIRLTLGDDEVQHSKTGALLISQILQFSDNWFIEFRAEGLYALVIEGKVREVNLLLKQLKYDADPTYQGYVPFVIQAFDRLNFGECSGKHICGAEKPEGCSDSREATPHQKAQEGLTRTVIDMTIGAPVRCNSSNCEDCNRETGCGFCYGVCGGKCMSGGASAPTFETCPETVAVIGSAIPAGIKYKQCELSEPSMIGVYVGVGVGAVAFCIIMYIFVKWTSRRHGGVLMYMKKKRIDARRVALRLNILPPDTANYPQFFFHFVVCGAALILVPILLRSEEPLCMFQKSYLIDKAEVLTMSLDNCRVRFVPSRTRPSPDNSLSDIKMQIAHVSHPLVKVDANTCGTHATLDVTNSKPDEIKYVNYWCSIELLVPDQLVLPAITIEAAGDNLTTVRSGPMDRDSPDFGLVFGPNAFTLRGNMMRAHLQNISAKYFNFDVVSGGLIAVDLTTTIEGTFKSVSADMTVTSKKRTSVEFWEKSANKVCLTAAKGSLFVDDACNSVCAMRTANSTRRRDLVSLEVPSSSERGSTSAASAPPSVRQLGQPGPPSMPLDLDSLPTPDRGASLRTLGANTITIDGLEIVDPVASDPRVPWVCTGDPATDEVWSCVNYNAQEIALGEACPAGSKFKTKQDVFENRIDGCTDLKRCIIQETSQCLCRPLCDMASLSPPGTCNTAGQCCQTLCAGYSKADMFPDEDMPRCGTDVDSTKYPWCDGNLGQFFRFTSDSGQISFQTLAECSPTSPGNCSTNATVHSYKGGVPENEIPLAPDIPTSSKFTLNEGFHPGGDTFPKNDLYTLSLNGPGSPDSQYGRFLAAKEVRHLVLPAWVMTVVSYDLLAPSKKSSNTRMDPGFCPAYTPTDSALWRERLMAMHRMLLDTVQMYPAEEEPKIMPLGALIAFVPLQDGLPIYFGVDLKTNTVTVSYIDPMDHPLLLMLLALGIGIPLFSALVVIVMAFFKGRAHLHAYRRNKLIGELTMMNLSAVLAGGGPDLEDDESIPVEMVVAMRAKSNFFFMFEDFIGNAESQKTIFAELLMVLMQQVLSIIPIIFPLLLGSRIREVYTKENCEYRPDICACLAETGGLSMVPIVINMIVFVYMGVAFLELTLHYLKVSYNLLRRVLRGLFYVLFFSMFATTLFVILVIILFVVLGILLKASVTLPYAIAIGGALIVAASYFAKEAKFQMRVQRAVTKNILMYKNKVAKSIPPALLDATMGRNIAQALHDNGLATPSIVIKVFNYLVAMGCVYFFLFTAFEAFTDSNDLIASLINDFILLIVVVLSYMVVVEEDISESFHKVDMMQEQIMESQRNVLDMMARQIETAQRLFKEMKHEMDDEPGGGEDEDDNLLKR